MKTWRIRLFRRLGIISGLGLAGYLVACYGENVDSVHFHGAGFNDKHKYDFGRVPQEVTVPYWTSEDKRVGTVSDFGGGWNGELTDDVLADYRRERHEPNVESFDLLGSPEGARWLQDYEDDKIRDRLHHARHIESAGEFAKAANSYCSVRSSNQFQSLANDRQELVDLGLKKDSEGYESYLRLTYLMEFGYDAQKLIASKELIALKLDPKLEPHRKYALAANMPDEPRTDRAKAFLAVAESYPQSPKAESALIMAGRTYVQGRSDEANWKLGLAVFDSLLRKHPKTRFRDDIEGWRGGYELYRRDIGKAIPHYIRESQSTIPREAWKGHQALATVALWDHRPADAAIHYLAERALPVTQHFRLLASKQIRKVFDGFSEKDAAKIQAKIRTSPKLLCSYLEFRIEDTDMNARDERNLLKFVSGQLRRSHGIDSATYSKIAILDYRVGRYGAALEMARRMRSGSPADRAKALYAEGSSLDRLGRHREAIRTFESLLRQGGPEYVIKPATEELALLQEKHGDPMRAFELYQKINYSEDMAFMVDCELTPTQIQHLIDRSSNHQVRSILKYSLAMRYFRRERYDDARRVLRTLPYTLRFFRGIPGPSYRNVYSRWSVDGETMKPPIDPLVDVDTMQKFRRRAENAPNQELRARALYGLAQYAHQRRNLMYYSPGLWMGGRSTSYPIFWNYVINRGKFQQLAMTGAFEHECYAQELKFCQEILRRCPRSSFIPKALYSAGTCCEHLSGFNGFWGEMGDHLDDKAVFYLRRLAREYPHDPLAKSAGKYADVFSNKMPDYEK